MEFVAPERQAVRKWLKTVTVDLKMSAIPLPSKTFVINTRERLFLLNGIQMSTEDVFAMNDSDFTYEFIKEKGIRAQNISAAGMGPKKLKEMGLENANQLRQLGFDSLYLADPKFSSEANSCFGSESVKEAFLQSASDAVSLAGTDAVNILGLQTIDLLNACIGAPTEAAAVLQQLPLGTSLVGVPASVLLDCALRKIALQNLGYSLTAVVSQTGANARQLAKLGFVITV